MENELTEKKTVVPAREIAVITAEIKEICRQAQNMALMYAIEIGRRLAEAKSALPYGAWGEWLKNEVSFSQSTAGNFMRLFDEYGSAQISIFGAVADSQTIGKLPYSKALQLLAVPADERESFAEEVHADELSVRELQEAIKAKADAEREAAEAKEREAEIAERAEAAENAAAEAEKKAAEADTLKAELESMTEKLKAADEKTEKTREKLKKALDNPQLSSDALQKIRDEAAEAAKIAAEADSAAALAEIRKKAEEAEAAKTVAELNAKVAREELDEAKKKIKVANPDVTAFKVIFDEMQESAKKLRVLIAKIAVEDSAVADKLGGALALFGAALGKE